MYWLRHTRSNICGDISTR